MSEDELKTFEAEDDKPILVDPLLKEQQAQVNQMRATLLSCNKSDPASAKLAIQNITVMRIYHQISRIIRFTDMMDRLEDKLYASIEANLAEMDEFDPNTMLMLTKIQSQLQETMIESQKLLQPYLDMDITAFTPIQEATPADSFAATIISKESRNNIRNGAQAVLTELTKQTIVTSPEPEESEINDDEEESINDLIAEAIDDSEDEEVVETLPEPAPINPVQSQAQALLTELTVEEELPDPFKQYN